MPPTPLGPDTAPVGSSDAAVAEGAALPVESAEKLVKVTHTQSIEFSAGPLPHPEFFQAYDDTLPARRIGSSWPSFRHPENGERIANGTPEFQDRFMGRDSVGRRGRRRVRVWCLGIGRFREYGVRSFAGFVTVGQCGVWR